MLILAIISLGMIIGALAQIILGKHGNGFDWGMALIAGLGGSFLGGLLFSLLAGDGLAIKPSGFIGSLVGALITTAIWRAVQAKREPAPQPVSAYHPPNNTTKNRNKNKSQAKRR